MNEIAAALIAAITHAEFTPCPTPIDRPPILLTIKRSPAPMVECPAVFLRQGRPIFAALATHAAACVDISPDEQTATVILPQGPAELIALGTGLGPTALIAHEIRHTRGMVHLPFPGAPEWCQ